MVELALSLEKLNFQKLRLLHDVAVKHDDAEMADFIGAPPYPGLRRSSVTGIRFHATSPCSAGD